MNILRKILLTIFGMATSLVLSILVLINGWGLEPKSWMWIIGIGYFGQIIAYIIIHIGANKE